MKLIDTINNISTDGFFKTLYNTYVPIYITSLDMANNLDYELYLNNGDKNISPMYTSLIDLESKGILANALRAMVGIYISKYGNNILKKYQVLNSNYNPIENYNLSETFTETNDRTSKESSSVNVDRVSKQSDNSNIYGFNSTTPVPQATGETDITNSTVANADSNFIENKNNDKSEHTLNRSGNIGVTTTQQMIESELKLREFSLFEDMLKLAVIELTNNIYD